MNDKAPKTSELFKKYIQNEIKEADLSKHRKTFIQTHFQPGPVFLIRPVVWAPAALVVLLILISLTLPIAVKKNTPMKPESAATVEPPPFSMVEAKTAEPKVEIRHVSSDVGSTMVYQKDSFQSPLTVIWVFTGGGK